MENRQIVTPQMEDHNVPTEQEIQNIINKYNDAKKQAKGEWVYSNEHGIVWRSFETDLMGGTPQLPNPTSPPPILSELIQWGKSLDLDSIKENSVMVVKLSSKNPYHAEQMQRGIVNMVLAPRAEKLKDKKLTVLFMTTEDDISIIEESEMEQAGWQKKNKSIIINPFNK